MEGIIKLIGLTGLAGFFIYIAYLFYDKNISISILLLVVGISLAIYLFYNEIEFKWKRHDEPWNFERYRGD